MESNHKWFEDWFNSPYYHLLYKHRDQQEAELFIDRLLQFLKLEKGATVLDLACGKGRHSIFLNKKGMDVTGLDLSEKSICCARQQENDQLHFYIHDMRKPFRINYYDAVFNLFTSFGYFERDKDDEATIKAVVNGLKPLGYFVFDFFNREYVIPRMEPDYTVEVDGISFRIQKRMEKEFIVKDIRFEHEGKEFHFSEKVKTYGLDQLKKLFEKSGLQVIAVKGNYNLEDFDAKTSDRLILIAQKKQS